MIDTDHIRQLFSAMGLDYDTGNTVAPTFSTKPPSPKWTSILFEVESGLTIYHLITKEKSITAIRTFMNGISREHYIIVVSLANYDYLFIKNYNKDSKIKYHTYPLRTDSEYGKAISIFRKYNITADILTAHANLSDIVKDMISSSESFTNRGLFSTYYLEKRVFKELIRKKRNMEKEASPILDVLQRGTSIKNVTSILESLGYDLKKTDNGYRLLINNNDTSRIIVTNHLELDVKHDDLIPSVKAVAALQNYEWVMLTNGKIWRMYSSKVSSSSTNYFELDLEQVDDLKDERIQYFVAVFSAKSLLKKNGESHLDLIHEGSVGYSTELEVDMRGKIFDGEMFVTLVRGVLDHNMSKEYQHHDLNDAKKKAVRILYRLLFILYAESRYLLPIDNSKYKEVSVLSIRDNLESFANDQESTTCWSNLKQLFSGINKGNPEFNLPQYGGKLFEESDIDHLSIRNRFLVTVIRNLTEKDGEKIDYQSLGVRHLGSIYEALLEYDVVQAKNDIVRVDDKIIEADFASDINAKPTSFIQKNDIYLSNQAMARKITGSYFTPEAIVKYLVKSGLEPIFEKRSAQFAKEMIKFRSGDNKSKECCNDIMLDLKVLDPSMGSGHFLVTVADDITRWIMQLIDKYPDAPIVQIIETHRNNVIKHQKNAGIQLNRDLLTSNSILKRIVMKQCIYGIDINELSVELTKLSLWLDSFTIGMPLATLRHHIRCGNALIGLHDDSNPKSNSLDKYINPVVKSAGSILHNISTNPDLISDDLDNDDRRMIEFYDRIDPTKKELDARCTHIIQQNTNNDTILTMRENHKIFHWQLEFPDAFTYIRPGFDLIVGNPPWESITPNIDEFFPRHDPSFRSYSTSYKKQVVRTLCENPDIMEEFNNYKVHIKEQSKFFRHSEQYVLRGSGTLDLWKLFLERILKLLTKDGTTSIVIPSAILANYGPKLLRKQLLLNMQIMSLYVFENKKKLFSKVHSSYKFVLLTAVNSKPSSNFKAAFNLHDIKSLYGLVEQEKFLMMTINLIKLTSRDVYAIPELRNNQDTQIHDWIYNNHGIVKDGLDDGCYTIHYIQEFNRTKDSELFRRDGRGWPLIEGKKFHQFIPDFVNPEFTIFPDDGLAKTKNHKKYMNKNKDIHNECMLAFRNVASSTNLRTMIACLLPPNRFFTHSCNVVVLHHNRSVILNDIYYDKILYLAAIFNSTTFDYLIRQRVDINLSYYMVDSIAIPQDTCSLLASQIIHHSKMLSMQHEDYAKIRKKYKYRITKLNKQQRSKIMAKLDALVARQYGISREQYQYILSTFKQTQQNIDSENLTWGNKDIQALNYEIQQRALKEYDKISN